MRIIAFGRSENFLKSIKKVSESGHKICLIITSEQSDHYSAGAEEFRTLAKQINADFLNTKKINDSETRRKIKKHHPDAGMSVNWKTKVNKSTLNCFPEGVLNCHAGDLPKYRGNAAVNWALINGESEIVFTLHFMNEEIDAGPILFKKEMPVDSSTRLQDVYEFGRSHIPELFVKGFDKIESGEATPKPQSDDPDRIIRCYPRLPRDSRIDWSCSADEIDRIVRASSEPLFGAYTYLNSDKLIIWKSHVETVDYQILGTPGQVARRDETSGEVSVVTGKDFLVLEEVEIEHEERQKATDVISSIRNRLGMNDQKIIHQLKQKIDRLESKIQK